MVNSDTLLQFTIHCYPDIAFTLLNNVEPKKLGIYLKLKDTGNDAMNIAMCNKQWAIVVKLFAIDRTLENKYDFVQLLSLNDTTETEYNEIIDCAKEQEIDISIPKEKINELFPPVKEKRKWNLLKMCISR